MTVFFWLNEDRTEFRRVFIINRKTFIIDHIPFNLKVLRNLFLWVWTHTDKYSKTETTRSNDACLPQTFVRYVPQTLVRCVPQTFVRCAPQTFVRYVPQAFVNYVPQKFVRYVPQTFVNCTPQTFVRYVPQTFIRCSPQTFVRCEPQTFIHCVPQAFVRWWSKVSCTMCHKSLFVWVVSLVRWFF